MVTSHVSSKVGQCKCAHGPASAPCERSIMGAFVAFRHMLHLGYVATAVMVSGSMSAKLLVEGSALAPTHLLVFSGEPGSLA